MLLINGEKVQKQCLNHGIKDLYDKFNNERGKKVSYSTFARYRPRLCYFPKNTGRETCACITHQNIQLLVKYLPSKNILSETSDYGAVESVTCEKSTLDCYSRQCKGCKNKKKRFKF